MKKYTVTYEHTIKSIYTVEVEADSEEEAKQIVENDPYSDEIEPELVDESGVDFIITDSKEIE